MDIFWIFSGGGMDIFWNHIMLHHSLPRDLVNCLRFAKIYKSTAVIMGYSNFLVLIFENQHMHACSTKICHYR